MGDEVTKKEYLNLEKLVDRMVKEFDDEKTVVHGKLDALPKPTDDTRLQKSISELKKWAEDTFEERKRWFEDERKATNDWIDGLTKWNENRSKEINDTFDERKRWFDDEKKVVHDELGGLQKSLADLKTWVEGELKKLQK